jgi:hypothetical protein
MPPGFNHLLYRLSALTAWAIVALGSPFTPSSERKNERKREREEGEREREIKGNGESTFFFSFIGYKFLNGRMI